MIESMGDDRKNLKVSPEVYEELNDAREMNWNDQLLHWKRMAEAVGEE